MIPSPTSELFKLLTILLEDSTSSHDEQLAHKILEHPGQGLAPPETERAFFCAMENTPKSYLASIEGLNDVHLRKIESVFRVAELYAHHRENNRRIENRPLQTEPREFVWSKIPDEYRNATREWFGFVPLYRNGKLGSFCVVEHGTRTHVNLDPLELFSRILAIRPYGLFLLHNHPSGEHHPSEKDLQLTFNIKQICDTLGLLLLDHGIVSPLGECWISDISLGHDLTSDLSSLFSMRKTSRSLRLFPDSTQKKSSARSNSSTPSRTR